MTLQGDKPRSDTISISIIYPSVYLGTNEILRGLGDIGSWSPDNTNSLENQTRHVAEHNPRVFELKSRN